MHDVVGHVVLAKGDVNLGAKHFVGAIRLRLGAGPHHRQIRTGLRLGQVHRAGPFTAHQFFKVSGFEFIRARRQQCFDGTIGQQWAQGKTHVGRIQHLNASRANRFGQALAAKVGWVLQTLPTAFGVLFVGLFETRRGGHHTGFPG